LTLHQPFTPPPNLQNPLGEKTKTKKGLKRIVKKETAVAIKRAITVARKAVLPSKFGL
jgi:hypothetical protein